MDMTCVCGTTYHEFRTGYTYRDIYDMLWSGSTDSSDWRYKGRSGVLGFWKQIKLEMWREHTRRCDQHRSHTMPYLTPQTISLLIKVDGWEIEIGAVMTKWSGSTDFEYELDDEIYEARKVAHSDYQLAQMYSRILESEVYVEEIDRVARETFEAFNEDDYPF